MPRRRSLLSTAALLALVAAGCADPTADSATSCAPPQLTWAADSAAAGDTVTLQGEALFTGCDDTGDGDPQEPLEITAAVLVVDGEPVEPGPAVDGAPTAADDGTLDMQVVLPPDLAEGAGVTAELTFTEGPAVVSDVLTVGG